MTAALQFRNLTLGYDRHPAVHHLTGEVCAGALLAVVGPNGAGKSTLFRGLVGILRPLAGDIARNGVGAREIAYLPQIADIDRFVARPDPARPIQSSGVGLPMSVTIRCGRFQASRARSWIRSRRNEFMSQAIATGATTSVVAKG